MKKAKFIFIKKMYCFLYCKLSYLNQANLKRIKETKYLLPCDPPPGKNLI